jgi:hypothetical protein
MSNMIWNHCSTIEKALIFMKFELTRQSYDITAVV